MLSKLIFFDRLDKSMNFRLTSAQTSGENFSPKHFYQLKRTFKFQRGPSESFLHSSSFCGLKSRKTGFIFLDKKDFVWKFLSLTVIRNLFCLNSNVLRAGHRAKAGCLAFELNMKLMFRFGQNKTDLFYGGLFEQIFVHREGSLIIIVLQGV